MQGSVASTPHLRRLGSVVTIGGVAAILFATLLPEPSQPLPSHLCLVCGTLGGVDAVLNVLLFIPLGLGLALSGIRCSRALLIVCALSLTVETTQFFFVAGRDASLGDVLTNTIGGALGFAVAWKAKTWLRPEPRIAATLGFGWCAVWLTIQAIASFALTPSFPDSRYYGQIARKLGNFAVFPGRVLSADIGGVAIADTRLSDIDSVRRLLLNGATVAVTVVPAGLTTDIAPILRVADGEQREIVLLAQDEQELLFGVRTGAAILRLRPLLFAMAGVFTDASATNNSTGTDSLSLSGRYDGRDAQLTARAGSAGRDRRVSVRFSLGWTLALPFQWFIEDTRAEFVISWIWMACLTFPIGYWSAHVVRISDRPANPILAVLCAVGGVAILIAGLVLVPHAFGLPAAHARDWVAAASGIVAGGAFASPAWKASGWT
jgi:VanZ like protein